MKNYILLIFLSIFLVPQPCLSQKITLGSCVTRDGGSYQGEMVENWSFYDKTLKVDNWNERLKLVNIFNDLTKNNFDIKYWIDGHFHNHFETQYNNVLLIGLDMCYSSKWRNRNNDEYKLYNDIFYINSSGKKGNIFKTN